MKDDGDRQRQFTEAATQTAGNPTAQRDWAANLRDEDLTYYVERARSWTNVPAADPNRDGPGFGL